MGRPQSSTPLILAGLAVLIFSAMMAFGALVRFSWAICGLLVSLVRLAHLSIVDRTRG